jgi:hypothetical protein
LDIEGGDESDPVPLEGEKMSPIKLNRLFYLFLIMMMGFIGTRCAGTNEELRETPNRTPKNYVYPLTEINLDKIYAENRGLKVLQENATAVHDYYRGGVQEKEEGETFLKEGNWEEARSHLEKSNQFMRVVLKVLLDDEAQRNIYGDQVVIFLPNLLIADNDLKLITVYKTLGDEDKAAATKSDGEYYLAESLKTVKTELADQIKKGLGDALSKR